MDRPTSRLQQRLSGGSPLARLRDVVRRHLLLVAGTPAALVLGTVVFLLVSTPIYEASTSIRIDERRSNVAVLDVLRTLSGGSPVNTEIEVLRSRTLAEEVVDSLDLDVRMKEPGRTQRRELLAHLSAVPDTLGAKYTFEREPEGVFRVRGDYTVPRSPGAILPFARRVTRELGRVRVGERAQLDALTLELAPDAVEHAEIVIEQVPFHKVVKRLRRELSVTRPVREASIAVARYEGPDPELVQAVPDLVARRFIAQRRAVHGAEAGSMLLFLGEQVDTVSRHLSVSEDALRSFRERNQVVAPEAEADAQVKRLVELRAQRDAFDAERAALARLVAEVEAAGPVGRAEPSPYRRLIAFPTLLRNPAASELLRVLAELENQRSELLTRRTADDPDVAILVERIRDMEAQLGAIAASYVRGLENQVASLDAVLAEFRDEVQAIPAKDIAFARLTRETQVLSEIYALLRTRAKEAEIAAAVEDVSIRVVDPAAYPREPVRPRPLLSLVLALALGTVLGVGGAFAREYADATIRTREELQGVTGLPVLGLLPSLDGAAALEGRRRGARRGRTRRPLLLSDGDMPLPLAEAFRALRTNLSLARPDAVPRSLVITSPMRGDGKTTTAANLGLVLAQQGRRVLVVDGDLRRGELHDLLGVPKEPGLSDVVAGRVALEEAIRELPVGDGRSMAFLSAGRPADDPLALLGSPAMERVLRALEERFELVILDAPPLNVVSDAAVLGSKAHAVLLVARAGTAQPAPLTFALEQLADARAPVLGAILNGVDPRHPSYAG
ncbi:MAG: polysaccharide biosynthesis tyrosine autokinase [Gemmatimonadetes bacterium]|nr:polysaccharide biosynthesis tyrosine autokinase [Gemmatimonadota bacterium]